MLEFENFQTTKAATRLFDPVRGSHVRIASLNAVSSE